CHGRALPDRHALDLLFKRGDCLPGAELEPKRIAALRRVELGAIRGASGLVDAQSLPLACLGDAVSVLTWRWFGACGAVRVTRLSRKGPCGYPSLCGYEGVM